MIMKRIAVGGSFIVLVFLWVACSVGQMSKEKRPSSLPVRIEVLAFREGQDLVVGFTPYNEYDAPVKYPGEIVVSIVERSTSGWSIVQLWDSPVYKIKTSMYKMLRVIPSGEFRPACIVLLHPDKINIEAGYPSAAGSTCSSIMTWGQLNGARYFVRVCFTPIIPKRGGSLVREDDFWW